MYNVCVAITSVVSGWVQDIAEDRQSAIPQDDIFATEGELISLNVYFTKNGPRSPFGLSYTIETGGSATGMIILNHFIHVVFVSSIKIMPSLILHIV